MEENNTEKLHELYNKTDFTARLERCKLLVTILEEGLAKLLVSRKWPGDADLFIAYASRYVARLMN